MALCDKSDSCHGMVCDFIVDNTMISLDMHFYSFIFTVYIIM